MIEETNPAGYASCCAAVRDFDYREKLGGIRCPTLVISGTHDAATTTTEGRFLAEQISGGQYAEVNAAHLSNLEDCHNFSSKVSAFLNA
jgi:3-oxoadipate enol-lactonase